MGNYFLKVDNIINSCIIKIDDSIYELESPAYEGNQTCSPEYVLSLLEKSLLACEDYGVSMIKLIEVFIY